MLWTNSLFRSCPGARRAFSLGKRVFGPALRRAALRGASGPWTYFCTLLVQPWRFGPIDFAATFPCCCAARRVSATLRVREGRCVTTRARAAVVRSARARRFARSNGWYATTCGAATMTTVRASRSRGSRSTPQRHSPDVQRRRSPARDRSRFVEHSFSGARPNGTPLPPARAASTSRASTGLPVNAALAQRTAT